MRLRNIPRAEQVLRAHHKVMKEEKSCRGRWRQVFGNENPVHIEIGMGKGQFLVTLAKQNKEVNYIGIERYSSVLLRAAEKFDEEEEQIDNIRFICMDAAEITEVFSPGEVDKIYLNFSDPWPKKRHARRRLTSKEFLARYERILTNDGIVEFKTDNDELFQFSLDQVEEAGWSLVSYTWDLHQDVSMNEGNVMTEYEVKFSSMGNKIHKLIAAQSVR